MGYSLELPSGSSVLQFPCHGQKSLYSQCLLVPASPTSGSGSHLHLLAAQVPLSHSMALHRTQEDPTLDLLPHDHRCSTGDTHHTWPGQPYHSSLYPIATGCSRFLRHESSVFSGFSLIHLTTLEGKAMDACPPRAPLPGGRATGDSQHSSSSLQEIPLPILPSLTPFNIFPLAEGVQASWGPFTDVALEICFG